MRINFDCFLCEEREGILRVDGREKYRTDLIQTHSQGKELSFFPGVEQRRKRLGDRGEIG